MSSIDINRQQKQRRNDWRDHWIWGASLAVGIGCYLGWWIGTWATQ